MKNSIGENIKRLRERDGMSLERVARMMEVDLSTVSAWEAGKSRPDDESIDLLARLFDVTVDELRGSAPEAEQDNAAEREIRRNADSAFSQNERAGLAAGFDSSPLKAWIGEGEHVLWYGKPSDEHVGGTEGIYVKIFGFFWLAFAILWTVMASMLSGFMGLFGLFFIAVGLYLCFGRSIMFKCNKQNIYYAVTDKRVMLCIVGLDNRFRDIRLNRLNEVRLVPSRRNTNCGTLMFNQSSQFDEYPLNRRRQGVPMMYSLLNAFYDIKEAGSVYNIINTAKAKYRD